METLEVEGLVIGEMLSGESDKLLTILTPTHGTLSVSGKGAAGLKSRFASSCQLFSYSRYTLSKTKKYWYIKDALYGGSFEQLRYDVVRLSLAVYISDIAREFMQEGVEDRELYRLVMNTLYAASCTSSGLQKPTEQLRAAFEFRTAVCEGFLPELSKCSRCGCAPDGECYLDVMNGGLLCRKCRKEIENDPEYFDDEHAKIHIRVTPDVLAAMRFIASADAKKFLSFSLEKEPLSLLSVLCERYLLNHIGHSFSSLDYYKKITKQINKLGYELKSTDNTRI